MKLCWSHEASYPLLSIFAALYVVAGLLFCIAYPLCKQEWEALQAIIEEHILTSMQA